MSEVREGYKMTELGEIPSEWEVIKLNDGVELLTDYTANGSFASLKENVTYFREPNYALLVRTTDLQQNNFDSGNVYTDQRGYDFLKKSALFGGELIMNNVGAGAGQVFIMPFLNRKATIAPNALVFKFNESLESKFMYHFFKSSIGQNELYKLSPTGALKNINKTMLKELVFASPPIKEQQKIAAILSTVDEQIDETEQLIVKTKELKKGLMQQLLTKGIGHTKYKKTELGEIPVDWKIKSLKAIGTFVKGKGIAKKDLSDKGVPCILYGQLYTKYKERIDNVTSYTELEMKNPIIGMKNDLLIPSSGETAIDIATASSLNVDSTFAVRFLLPALAPAS